MVTADSPDASEDRGGVPLPALITALLIGPLVVVIVLLNGSDGKDAVGPPRRAASSPETPGGPRAEALVLTAPRLEGPRILAGSKAGSYRLLYVLRGQTERPVVTLTSPGPGVRRYLVEGIAEKPSGATASVVEISLADVRRGALHVELHGPDDRVLVRSHLLASGDGEAELATKLAPMAPTGFKLRTLTREGPGRFLLDLEGTVSSSGWQLLGTAVLGAGTRYEAAGLLLPPEDAGDAVVTAQTLSLTLDDVAPGRVALTLLVHRDREPLEGGLMGLLGGWPTRTDYEVQTYLFDAE